MEKFSTEDSAPKAIPRQQVTNLDSLQLDTQGPESPISGSQGINSFEINLSSDDNAGGTSNRPLGVKKSKLKKKKEHVSELISSMKEGHREILSVLQQGCSDTREMRMLALQNEQKKISIRQEQLALAKHQEENKILYMDVSTIGDPVLRQIVENDRARIMQKREEERRQQEGNSFGQFW
ncbi:uncharacterized protein [Henckelia pumila]|uniref:uncharacterized protein n=1 Tax=Henckelia pumila TaxID=405737 RepID=UPI003C6E8E17